MIVNLIENGWEVIYHRAHALLAAQIAINWQTPDDTARLVDTVAAISHHDDSQREWHGNSITKVGAPFDFTLGNSLPPVPPLYEHVEDALYRGRWVGLLVSMHMSFLMEGRRKQDKELDQFLDSQLNLQTSLRKSLKVNKTDAEKTYAMMQCCDRLSLILCQRQIPEGERILEIAKGPTGERHDILRRADNTLTVKPWPFKDSTFTVHVDASYLTQIEYKSNEQLIEALKTATVKLLEWTFVK